MRVITKKPLQAFWQRHSDAEKPLSDWHTVARSAAWKNIADVRRQYPHADAVKVSSGRIVTVFDIGGNKYRLVTAIHYDTQVLFVLRVMTHADYDRERWKDEL